MFVLKLITSIIIYSGTSFTIIVILVSVEDLVVTKIYLCMYQCMR